MCDKYSLLGQLTQNKKLEHPFGFRSEQIFLQGGLNTESLQGGGVGWGGVVEEL